MQETLVQFLGWEDPLEKGYATHSSILGLSLVAQMVKNSPAMWETWVQSLGWEDSPGEGKGYPLQYSCLENPHGQAWWATVQGISKSQTQLSN